MRSLISKVLSFSLTLSLLSRFFCFVCGVVYHPSHSFVSTLPRLLFFFCLVLVEQSFARFFLACISRVISIAQLTTLHYLAGLPDILLVGYQ